MMRQVVYHEPVCDENDAAHATDKSDRRSGGRTRSWHSFQPKVAAREVMSRPGCNQ